METTCPGLSRVLVSSNHLAPFNNTTFNASLDKVKEDQTLFSASPTKCLEKQQQAKDNATHILFATQCATPLYFAWDQHNLLVSNYSALRQSLNTMGGGIALDLEGKDIQYFL